MSRFDAEPEDWSLLHTYIRIYSSYDDNDDDELMMMMKVMMMIKMIQLEPMH